MFFIAVFGFTVGSINSRQNVGVLHFIGVMFAFGDNIETISYKNCRSSPVSVTLYFSTIETSV
ncbi:MAG: hypothetical protein LBT46_11865 [Planctomycetaceae bacterium]|jgi:hypothetical protein|nr:hypothetical protein [Planctomycetaceae bacterium]